MEKTAQPRVQAPQTESQGLEQGMSMEGPEGGQVSQLQAAADESPQVKQLRSLQAAANASAQVSQLRKQQAAADASTTQRQENKTGMPDQLKSGMENLSGMAMDDVRVHYNSSEPAQLQAHAFAQGSDIHIAPGQEQHLAHEAWHVVQQKQGRVKPTLQRKGIAINDDSALETEADVMGARALGGAMQALPAQLSSVQMPPQAQAAAQLRGAPPYRKNITLQTNYLTLDIRHAREGVSEADSGAYQIARFQGKSTRPPAHLDGKEMASQGQHKVAWVAIAAALERCVGKSLDEAHTTMDGIVEASGIVLGADEYKMSVAMGLSSPAKADALLGKGHQYLVARQKDNPSWEARGDAEDKRNQLKGKGERELVGVMQHWQKLAVKDLKRESITDWLKYNMTKLFDTTGREDGELDDVLERVKIELNVQNPELYAAKKKDIEKWVDSHGKPEPESEPEAEEGGGRRRKGKGRRSSLRDD